MSLVRDIVHDRDLVYVEEGESVAAVARKMAGLQVGAIAVLRGGALRGVFSERDLLLRVVVAGRNPELTPVERVMSIAVVTVDEQATAEDAMGLMQSNHCRHLPVMRGSDMISFLSMRDLMDFELARKAEDLHHMRTYIQGS